MAWLRIGDNAVTHPHMSKLLEATDLNHQAKNEAFSVFVQLAAVSAAHLTDAWVEMGMLAQIAPGREKAILDVLCSAGLAAREKIDGRWQIHLLLDDEEFVHARSRAEVMIDRNRSKDKRTPGLYVQVRVRDGDECRWCGRSVSWRNRSGSRGGTIDSLNGHKNSTVETLVVACRGCNSKRHEGVHMELKNPPANPYYTKETIEAVNEDQWSIENNIHIEPRQGSLELGLSKKPNPVQHASGMAADSYQESSAHAAAAPGMHGAPATNEAPGTSSTAADRHQETSAHAAAAPGGRGAPATDRSPAVAGQSPWEDAPDWVTKPDSEVLGRAAASTSGSSSTAADSHQESSAHAAAAPGVRGAPACEPPATAAPPESPPECNESVKPGTDLGREGDAAGTVGSGRAGKGREGQVSVSGSRRRRGRRGGKRKPNG